MQALPELVSQLGADFPAPVLIAFHIGSYPVDLPGRFSSRGALRAQFAVDGAKVEAGYVVVAPPDHHLLVDRDRLKLSRTARENFARPAIDPLFRSAGYAYRHRVVGVLLTGQLDDGSVGLQAIKAYGGTTVVQDPEEAAYPEMPASAVAAANPDYVLPLRDIPRLLRELVPTTAKPTHPSAAAERFSREDQMATGRVTTIDTLNAIGTPSSFSCPECGGAIWQIGDPEHPHYRCHTGHAFSTLNLALGQEHAVEEALWNAVRAMEEKRSLFERRASAARLAGNERSAHELELSAQTTAEQLRVVRQLVTAGATAMHLEAALPST
jgi:two-component system chemotaxis response regulator CheB